MSGRIRMAVPHLVKSLDEKLAKATDLMKRFPKEKFPDNVEECTRLLSTAEEVELKINASKRKLEEKDAEWNAIYDHLTDTNERDEESKHMERIVYSDNGYANLLQEADDILASIQIYLKRLVENIQRLDSTNPVNQTQRTSHTNNADSRRSRIPDLVLPKFSGDYNAFPQFWSIFEASIDSKSFLQPIEKFCYLLSHLDGTAKNTVEGLMVTDANYPTAIKLLKERFQQSKPMQITSLYAEFKKIRMSGNTIIEKRNTYDQCEKILRQLENAGENLTANHALTIEYLSKFPGHVLHDLSKFQNITTESALDDVRKELLIYLTKAERMNETLNNLRVLSGASQTNQSKQDNKKNERDSGFKPHSGSQQSNGGKYKGSEFVNSSYTRKQESDDSSAFLVQDRFDPAHKVVDVKVSTCYFCGKAHFNGDCNEYDTVQTRKKCLLERNRCPRCARLKHEGKCKKTKDCWHCKSKEHISCLCPSKFPEKRKEPDPQQKPGGRPDDSSAAFINSNTRNKTVLMTASCEVVNNQTGESTVARVILDSASHRDYITEKLCKKLNLPKLHSEEFSVKVFGTETAHEMKSYVVSFGLKLRDGTTMTIESNTTPMISDISVLPTNISSNDQKVLEPFKSLLADNYQDSNGQVDILLGGSYFWELINDQPVTTATNLKLIPSKLGLLLGGRMHTEHSEPEVTMFCGVLQRRQEFPDIEILSKPPAKSEVDVSQMWNLESIGIHEDPIRSDDEHAMEIFMNTVKFNEDQQRYEVQWPWLPGAKEKLPTNQQLALGRFRSLTRRLASDVNLFSEYRKIVKLQVERGMIEQVPKSEVEDPKFPTHYLPHHPVIKPDRATTKIRIVYDASARVRRGAPSLNESIFRGPVILPNLCETLVRFRMNPVAVIADLEKAFLQLSLAPCDRDVNRFFWYENDKQPSYDGNIAVYRFCRVAFGIIASPFLLGAVIRHHLMKSDNAIHIQAARDTYVDNLITGTATVEEAKMIYTEMKSTFQGINMNLQEWCTNSKELHETFAEHDKVKNRDTKVLGLRWDSEIDDTLRLTNSSWNKLHNCSTKREVMRAIATIYDPLGFYQPAVLPAKLLLQSLWEQKYEWDEQLPATIINRWNEIQRSISYCFEHRIPRYVGTTNIDSMEIVGFSDASEKAYSAVLYLRFAKHPPQLIFAKSRLPPKAKTITLPRLELLGAFICAKAVSFLRKAVQFNIPAILFTDSQIVLNWLISSKLLSKFVTNRIATLRELNNVEYNYVSSDDNPADKATRGIHGSALIEDAHWWHGPSWLSKSREHWPQHDVAPITEVDIRAAETEVLKTPVFHSLLTGEGQTTSEPTGLCALIDMKRFSSMTKLLRVTVMCLKFVRRKLWNKLSQETRAKNDEFGRFMERVDDETIISADELREAKRHWVHAVQRMYFTDVFKALTSNKRHSLVNQLGLRIDADGIIRSYSRFEHAELPDDLKHPRLLPKNSEFTRLAIDQVHRAKLHVGVAHTLAELRREFWVPQGRQAVRKIITKCPKCRKLRGSSFRYPNMPPWPTERVSRSSPFKFSGLDYFGPITVKSGDNKMKCWVCIFTCLAIRAIHLEYVADNTSVEFLNCLKRFMGRRGVPSQVISDNAAQFRVVQAVSERVWSSVLSDDSVYSFCAERGIKWKFIAQLAPWQGGFYERLIGVVKSVLRAAVGRKLLEVQEFMTLLVETEAIVNSRPITCVTDDVHSRLRIIRPADFLTDLPIIDANTISEEVNLSGLGKVGTHLAKYWKQRNMYLDKLWKRWQEEYLLNLRERGSASHHGPRNATDRTPKVNEVVLVHEESPRMTWKIAKVMKLIFSSDGEVRSAEIRLPNKQIIRRSVKHLYPLEVPTDETIQENNETSTEDDFFGFSEEDVEETRRLLQRYNNLDVNNPDDDESAAFLCVQIRSAVQRNLNAITFLILM